MVPTLAEHLHVVAGQPPRAGVPVLATVGVYAAVASAGLLAAPSLTGVVGRRRVRGGIVLALLTGHLAMMLAADQASVGTTAVVAALVMFAGSTLLLSARVQIIGAFAIGVGQVALDAEGSAAHAIAVGVHLLAASVWVGGVIHLALVLGCDRSQLRPAIRRFTPYAVTSGALLVASGWLLLVVHRVGLAQLTATTFGTIVLVKAMLLAAAAALGLAHRTGRPWPDLLVRHNLLRVEAGLLGAALGFAAVLAGMELPAAAVLTAGPGLVEVDLGAGEQASLEVVGVAPATGLVRNLGDRSLLVKDRRSTTTHQLGPGRATRVDLANGRADLQLTSGGRTRTVTVSAAAPAQAEAVGTAAWLDYQLGRALATGSTTPRPAAAASCASSGTSDGAALGQALRRAGARRVAVVHDTSAAAAQLVAGLRQGGVALSSHAPTLLVATSTAKARLALRHIAARPGVQAVYLAPWLLDSKVLSMLATLRLPPVLVASTVDAMSPDADRYRVALSRLAGGVGPSVAGLRGFESIAAPALLASHSLTLYSAAPVGFLPGVLDVGHDHGATGWFSNGTLVPVSSGVTVRSSACANPTV